MPFDDASISADSVFDWGNTSGGTSSRSKANEETLFGESQSAAATDERKTYSGQGKSRYDPEAMNRITNIVDDLIHDGSSDEESDDYAIEAGGGKSSMEVMRRGSNKMETQRTKYGPGGVGSSLFCRQTAAILSLVIIIIVASLAIGFAIPPNNNPAGGTASQSVGNGVPDQQRLEIAERVVSACSEQKLNGDLSECQKLCHSKLCCFQGGDYSCEMDESKDCAVYAGCEALVEGIAMDTVETNS
mmetsp:Transcript_7733/g.16817  ORF Transcript_7733/g.16817 Transcript_7733/m.16817 type:complete len:245 (-) Transcript_7733:392-1126(-)